MPHESRPQAQTDPMQPLGQVSASELKARGWTETMIARLLGAPCATARNPHYPSAAPVRLYATERVLSAQHSPEFAKARSRAETASRRARKAHRAKAAALVQSAWQVELALPGASDEALRSDAEERLASRLAGQALLPMGEEELIAGYAVELLLEASEPAQWTLDEHFALSGVRAARAVLRKRILGLIAERHPWLSAECVRRFRSEDGSVDQESACGNLALR